MKIINKRRLYRFDELKQGEVFKYGNGIYMKYPTNPYYNNDCSGLVLDGNYTGMPYNFKGNEEVDLLRNVKLVVNDNDEDLIAELRKLRKRMDKETGEWYVSLKDVIDTVRRISPEL